MRMAFQLAIKNGISHPFSDKKRNAGWKLFHKFMRRHSQLSLRRPQPTSAARAKRITPENVLKFFDIYEPLLEMVQFTRHCLYNCDETGLTVVQHKVCNAALLTGSPNKNKLTEDLEKKLPRKRRKRATRRRKLEKAKRN
jgi:aryl-alcohol dehydrogenase-like predicted oxidoreductase